MTAMPLIRAAVVIGTILAAAAASAQPAPNNTPAPTQTPPSTPAPAPNGTPAPTPAPPPAQTPAPPPPQASGASAAPQTLTVDEFRRELVGIPLCGTPTSGPLAGKALCSVHLPDGTAIVAGAGLVVRGVWEGEAGRICRRNAHDPIEKRRCVEYERVAPERYRNSDGVEFCLGPCPN